MKSTYTLESQEEQDRALMGAVLENISRIRMAANEPLDDIFEYGRALAPSRFVWCNISVNDWVNSEKLRTSERGS